MTYRLGSLCSGAGALDMAAAQVLGDMEHAWSAESDPAASKVLAHHWPNVANLGDITAVDWATTSDIDVLTAGFPCQDVSAAGKRAGLMPGNRSGLWRWVAHVIATKHPPLVLLENVGGLLSARAHSDMEPCPWCVGDDPDRVVLRALGAVLGDLADLGYDATWAGVRASDVGAAHRRFRVFVLAAPADAPRLGYRDGGTQGGQRVPAAAVGGAVRPGGDDGLSLPPPPAARVAGRGGGYGDQPGRPLSETILRLLPTPAARLGERWGAPNAETAARRMYDDGRRNLEDALALLPTPRATDGTKGGPNQRGSSGDLMLPSAVMLLPTPVVTDAKGASCDGWTLSDIAHADRWGEYGPAIARWEAVTGRSAPDPTEPGRNGQPRLSARFVEWLMGWPDGWVTDLVGRNDALRICGNGVVTQQAAYAIAALLDLHWAEVRT